MSEEEEDEDIEEILRKRDTRQPEKTRHTPRKNNIRERKFSQMSGAFV